MSFRSPVTVSFVLFDKVDTSAVLGRAPPLRHLGRPGHGAGRRPDASGACGLSSVARSLFVAGRSARGRRRSDISCSTVLVIVVVRVHISYEEQQLQDSSTHDSHDAARSQILRAWGAAVPCRQFCVQSTSSKTPAPSSTRAAHRRFGFEVS